MLKPIKIFLLIFIVTSIISFSQQIDHNVKKLGAVIRTDTTKKVICLAFTGHDHADGLELVRKVLMKHKIHGNFFFTGVFYRNPDFKNEINKLIDDGNYLGAHSDEHLLYASWERRDSTLVTEKQFKDDLEKNYESMAQFGISKKDAKIFLPPFEWYNQQIADWCNDIGLTLVDFTPGTSSNQDWTYPGLGKQYVSSDTIFNRIVNYEKTDPNGLNGFILLTHPGTDERRSDKFYNRLDELITLLEHKGYQFKLISEALKN